LKKHFDFVHKDKDERLTSVLTDCKVEIEEDRGKMRHFSIEISAEIENEVTNGTSDDSIRNSIVDRTFEFEQFDEKFSMIDEHEDKFVDFEFSLWKFETNEHVLESMDQILNDLIEKNRRTTNFSLENFRCAK